MALLLPLLLHGLPVSSRHVVCLPAPRQASTCLQQRRRHILLLWVLLRGLSSSTRSLSPSPRVLYQHLLPAQPHSNISTAGLRGPSATERLPGSRPCLPFRRHRPESPSGLILPLTGWPGCPGKHRLSSMMLPAVAACPGILNSLTLPVTGLAMTGCQTSLAGTLGGRSVVLTMHRGRWTPWCPQQRLAPRGQSKRGVRECCGPL